MLLLLVIVMLTILVLIICHYRHRRWTLWNAEAVDGDQCLRQDKRSELGELRVWFNPEVHAKVWVNVSRHSRFRQCTISGGSGIEEIIEVLKRATRRALSWVNVYFIQNYFIYFSFGQKPITFKNQLKAM